MPELSLTSLAVILAVAFLARLALGLWPRLRLPGVVVEIVAGIAIGPAVLGWATVDEPVRIVALLGLAFVLFLSGLELDLAGLRGGLLRAAAKGVGVSVALALAAATLLDRAGLIANPLLVAVALLATSLGLVVPVLKESDLERSRLGQLVIAGATLGDFAAIVALSLLFSRDASRTSTRLVLLGVFVALVGAATLALVLGERSSRLSMTLLRLQDTTAQIRVRGAVLLVVGLAVLAEKVGLEAILGAFVAGALLGTVDRDTMRTHPFFHAKLEALGYGFLVPVFFVTSGIRFDLDALFADASTLALVPLFLGALVVARGVPALAYRSQLVGRRELLGAALLQATSLPVIVTATMIGVETGALTPGVAAAFVAAGLVSALVFPAAATALVGPKAPAGTGGQEPKLATMRSA